MGSGTTNLACIKTNRQFIGIEKEKQKYLLFGGASDIEQFGACRKKTESLIKLQNKEI